MWITVPRVAVLRWRVIGCDLLPRPEIAAGTFVVAESESHASTRSFLGCCVERRSGIEACEVVNPSFQLLDFLLKLFGVLVRGSKLVFQPL